MTSVYNHWLVGLSVVVAMLVSYTALRLAARVAASEGRGARIWLAIGSVAMGIGIWSMHFIGMLAFSLPIPLAYDVSTTLLSLAVAIGTSGFALAITSGQRLTMLRLGCSAVAMGAGIASMHYMGMAAIEVVPAIAYRPWLVALSVVIAVTASFVVLSAARGKFPIPVAGPNQRRRGDGPCHQRHALHGDGCLPIFPGVHLPRRSDPSKRLACGDHWSIRARPFGRDSGDGNLRRPPADPHPYPVVAARAGQRRTATPGNPRCAHRIAESHAVPGPVGARNRPRRA